MGLSPISAADLVMSTRHCLSHTALGPKRFMKSKKAKVKLTTRGPLPGLQVDPDSVSLLAIPPAIPGTGVHGGARRPRCDRRQCRPSGPQRRLWKTSGLRVEKCRRDFEISAGWSLTDSLRSLKARPHTRTQDFGWLRRRSAFRKARPAPETSRFRSLRAKATLNPAEAGRPSAWNTAA